MESSQKVLIADDDLPTRILLRAAIKQWGYESIEAKDGEEALEILRQSDPPRLLIIDWLMPKLDGLALCAKIKQELSLRSYIIILTQVSGTTNIIKGLEAGADEFLIKPFNMAELRSRLGVGAKIVNFENKILKQAAQLDKFISQMEFASNKSSKIYQDIYNFSKTNNTKIQSFAEEINDLNNTLESMIKDIKSFRKNLMI